MSSSGQKGYFYDNGQDLSMCHRERVLDLYHYGKSERGIAREVRVSRKYVNNVIKCSRTLIKTNITFRHHGSEMLDHALYWFPKYLETEAE